MAPTPARAVHSPLHVTVEDGDERSPHEKQDSRTQQVVHRKTPARSHCTASTHEH